MDIRVVIILLSILLPRSVNGDGSALPGNCTQPPNTSMIIYNKDDPNILTQKTPAGECECMSDPTKKIYFFSPGEQIPPTGPKAGESPIGMQCRKKEDYCVCDESDVCWTVENAYAELIINPYCDPTCHNYVRMNNIEPKTQTLVSDNGQQIKLSDQLMKINEKQNSFKKMESDSNAYVKVCGKKY
ncbi:unnamed protein product [Meloidogyne enterolobii]|uniref:Uncharacterized protein n=1 Tax=Meloidogyne enterolobii TaxID=390850 RepID=A0ACB0ZPR9_MELEN